MSNKSDKDYYLGLDCGVSSVGWAVTDPDYNLLRLKGKTAWGARLFDEASTAAERRSFRSNRRRIDRADSRLKLLRELMKPEIAKVDPDFYRRLDESFYRLEDKQGLIDPSADTLFNDPNFGDKDLHEQYPTIWHLRHAIIAGAQEHFDIRLYFLAIQHILKHRGHFLIEGELKGNAGNFEEIYQSFCQTANEAGFAIRDDHAKEIEQIILDKKKSKIDAKKELKELLLDLDKQTLDIDQGEDVLNDHSQLAGLLIGSQVDLRKLFNLETTEKCGLSFANTVFEDKLPELEQQLSENPIYLELIFAAKRIYDYRILKHLLGSAENISEAMVNNYNLHQEDLKLIKKLLSPFRDDYQYFFREEQPNEKDLNYVAYIGKAYSANKSGRKKSLLADQATINASIKRLFEKHAIDLSKYPDFANRLDNGMLLPKQRGQAKGTIPQQLHHNELEIILQKLCQDYPYFAKTIQGEQPDYNTIAKKIASIHNFRRPYFCGPLVSKDKSEFSWADEEIKQIVYPWNFKSLVNLEQRAEKFIERMTNDCTYLRGEKVLPKASPLYQKYMVLNEINNLKIDGSRIDDQNCKQRIYKVFQSGELTGSISIRRLEKELRSRMIISQNAKLSGSAENKYLPKLSTIQDFKRILGQDYATKYPAQSIEEAVKAITILSNDKDMLTRKLETILHCSEDEAAKLAKLAYKDWGKFSAALLTGIKAPVNRVEMTILDALLYTNHNFMELLGNQFSFSKAIEKFNGIGEAVNKTISYADVDALYCSPAVKRSVWQAVKIAKEIIEIKGSAPAKIFLESTREQKEQGGGKETLARRRQLIEKYKNITGSQEAKELLVELDSCEDSVLQQKKLYLYYCQMGRCAYSGEAINPEELATSAYDIDHIYPRSLTKDDSITRNLVLVKSELNRDKTNIYPVSADIRQKMSSTWKYWCGKGLITKEKYDRLIRATHLTDEELGGFISRQIVETSQTVKAIRDLFRQAFPDTEVVLVKAGQVSDLRRCYGYGHKDRKTDQLKPGHPEFIKVRALNDLHHAKDAYLNIVVGDVMLNTFTHNPVAWIREKHPEENKHYSLRTDLLFDPYLETMSKALMHNDALVTRMAYSSHSALFKQTILGSSPENNALAPVKNTGRLRDVNKYGGYDKISGAYFALIETKDKKGNTRRRIVQIPGIFSKSEEQYISKRYGDAKIILPYIPFKAQFKIGPLHLSIAGRVGDNIIYHPAMQNKLDLGFIDYLKKVETAHKKISFAKAKKQTYTLGDKDGITAEGNANLMNELCQKNTLLYRGAPRYELRQKLSQSAELFKKLSLENQCTTIMGMLKLLSCNAEDGKNELAVLDIKTAGLSQLIISGDITNCDAHLISQSVTGLIETRIDLNKIKPKERG